LFWRRLIHYSNLARSGKTKFIGSLNGDKLYSFPKRDDDQVKGGKKSGRAGEDERESGRAGERESGKRERESRRAGEEER
jgi:hypothetical protein